MVFDNIHVTTDDEKYMLEALKEAKTAADNAEVPVGAVIVRGGEIIARAHNMVETNRLSHSHAEMLAIDEAEHVLGRKWLSDSTMYVTLEPCSMCAGALVLSRIGRLVIGAADPKTGACGSVINVTNNDKLNHRIDITTGILEEECGELLRGFFREKRANRQV